VLAHELFVAIRPGGLSAAPDATTKGAPLAMVGQARPMPEVALRTTLAAAGVKRCTRCSVVKALSEFPRVPGRARMASWCRPCSNRSSKASMQRSVSTVVKMSRQSCRRVTVEAMKLDPYAFLLPYGIVPTRSVVERGWLRRDGKLLCRYPSRIRIRYGSVIATEWFCQVARE
jgi:hypothetical protein